VSAEPIAITVRRFKCPFCAASRSVKKAAAAHIDRCWRNPATRTCKTCQFFYPGDPAEPEVGYPGMPPSCMAGQEFPTDGPMVDCSTWESQERAS
jgi:hypothetical protein